MSETQNSSEGKMPPVEERLTSEFLAKLKEDGRPMELKEAIDLAREGGIEISKGQEYEWRAAAHDNRIGRAGFIANFVASIPGIKPELAGALRQEFGSQVTSSRKLADMYRKLAKSVQ